MSQTSGFNQDLEIKIALAPHYTAEEKVFILGFYNELANCYDDKILDLLNKKRKEIYTRYFSSNFKNEVDFIFYSIEESTKKFFKLTDNKGGIASRSYSGGFLECIVRKVPGKDLGKVMVYGIATGAVRGAFVGATTGTFTVPILGTAVGAVGGAVFGAAAGAVSGVVGSYVWPAIDCIMYPKAYEEKFLTDEFFEDEMPYFDLDREEMDRFNDLLNLPVTSVVNIIEL